MKPIWNDRFERDELGQPIRTERAALGWVREAASAASNVEHWIIKALFTSGLSVVVAFATARLTTKHEDTPKVGDVQKLNARVALLEARLQDLERQNRALIGRDANHDRVSSAQNHTALNTDANQQPPAKP